MTILQTHTFEDGVTVGFDSEVNDWVPIDKAASKDRPLAISAARLAGHAEIGQG
jgi:hypothetical protein